MYTVKLLNTIAKIGLDHFPTSHYTITTECSEPDAILLRSHNLHHEVLPPSVKVVGRAGAGVNNIPVSTLTQRGIPVLNTPGSNANAVKELVIAGMLLSCRHLCIALQYVNQLLVDDDDRLHQQIEAQKKQFVGTELIGKTLGVIGLGSIGARVANAAAQLGMHVVGYDPALTIKQAWELSPHIAQAHQLNELLAMSDFVSCHVPLNETTRGMISTQQLAQMKKGATLLNFSRHPIVDPLAILTAVNEKHLAAYVSDFPATIFHHHPRIICFPHLGASTVEAEENCATIITKHMRAFLEHGVIHHSVNFPTVDLPPLRENTRLLIVNANVPNMVAQISKYIGQADLNIINLINKSRDQIAYTAIDLSPEPLPIILEEIAAIPGVLQTRIIKPMGIS